MKHLIYALATTLVIAPICRAGSISGTVKGSDGSTVTAGSVIGAWVGTGAAGPRPQGGAAVTEIQPDGTFQLSLSPVGTYQICVVPRLSSLLNSCEWGNNGTTVTLTQDQPAAALAIVLTKGAAIGVRVNDAAGLLSANEGQTAGAHLLVGVGIGNMAFRLATIISHDAGGRTYQVIVPFGRSVGITVGSAFFQLTDATGKALPKFGNVFPVAVSSGAQPPTLTLNVVGTAQP